MLRRGLICEPATADTIDRAAQALRAGGLVAFPTETVYGLGADGFNPSAVAQIYRMKGRPDDNPLILHVAAPSMAAALAEIDELTVRLMEAFWPGPLTLVLRKKASLPAWVGGHPTRTADTIAVRLPAHPVAQALIRQAGCAVAAPSANKAGTPSPTCAAHVAADFPDETLYLLDDGPVPGGVESTVLDLTGETPVILRPGAVTAERLGAILGVPVAADAFFTPAASENRDKPVAAPRSPGMKYRHYAPRAPMVLVTGEPKRAAAYIISQVTHPADVPAAPSPRWGILATAQTAALYTAHFGTRVGADIVVLTMGDRDTPETIARELYACLRQFDALAVTHIYAEGIAETGLGAAIMNRMKKAAGGRIV